MTQHKHISTERNHIPYNWEYADATAREAATDFDPADVGNFARQLDDNTIWMLIDDSPETWVQIGGGRALIDTASPTGTGTVTFSGIPDTYSKLTLEMAIRGTNASDFVYVHIQFNADTTATNYRYAMEYMYAAGTQAQEGGDDNKIGVAAAGSSPANSCGVSIIQIPFYAGAFKKQALASSGARRDDSSVHEFHSDASVEWENTDPIDEISIVLSAGNYAAPSIINLYGER